MMLGISNLVRSVRYEAVTASVNLPTEREGQFYDFDMPEATQ